MFIKKGLVTSTQTRLTALISPREVTNYDSTKNETELLLRPPSFAFRPIARGFALFSICLVLFWWLNKPVQISKIESLTNQSGLATPGLAPSEVVVHVTGEVNNPGVVKLPVGSRVIDAIAAAGGLTSSKSETNLNLAAHVEDGQLIYVGQEEALTTDPRLNLNSATAAQLEQLPGVGPVMANRILEWRASNNRFSTIDELQEIEGIGPKLFNRLRELVRV